jgi:hypothetical protein
VADDILPPAPPGTEQVASTQKRGLFSRLFKKKNNENNSFSEQNLQSEALKIHEMDSHDDVPEPSAINPDTLDNIRRQLGLDNQPEIPEPPKIINDNRNKEDDLLNEMKKESSPFPLPNFEPVDFTKEIDEPPKIEKNDKHSLLSSKDKKKPLLAKDEPKKQPADSASNWTTDVHSQPINGKKSSFDIPVPPKIETATANTKPKAEFLQEVKPESVKALAKNIKRKNFEDKKGIKYEPEIKQADIEKINDEPMLFSEVKEELLLPPKIENISPSPIKVPQFTQEPEQKKLVQEPVKPAEAPAVKHDKVNLDKIREEIRKELKAQMKDKIRSEVHEEELAKIRKDFEKKESDLEKEKKRIDEARQSLEQEKIVTAGTVNKFSFKEKQLAKDREALVMERSTLNMEHKQLFEDKEEAEELLKKLPLIKKDYEKLQEKMKEFGEQVKLNTQLEENLKRREEALLEAQQKLDETSAQLKEGGMSGYLESELKNQEMVSSVSNDENMIKDKHIELYSLIEECRSLVWKNQIAEAKAFYMKLRDEYKKSDVRGDDREMLYNAIRELYDDINLAGIN